MSDRRWKLGVAFNVFDGVELLAPAARSVRACASFVAVVYQTKSNFGVQAPPHQRTLLAQVWKPPILK